MKLTIGIPTRGEINGRLAMWLAKQSKMFDITPIVGFCKTDDYHAYVKVFNAAFKSDCDYFILIQDDIIPYDGVIEGLVSPKKDVVIAPVWHFDGQRKDIHLGVHFGEFKQPEQGFRLYRTRKGVERCSSGGFGCVCISRKVIDKFNNSRENPLTVSNYVRGFVGQELDNIFFEKLKLLGLEVWVNWDIDKLIHNRYIALDTEVLENFVRHYG